MLEAALNDLQRYLDDAIPPATAANALATLMAQPPAVMMQHVGNWAVEQSEIQSTPVSMLLLVALKKVYVAGELRLLDPEAVANYLDRAMTLAIRMCPEADRDFLRASVTSMRMSRDTNHSQAEVVRLPTYSGRTVVPDADSMTAKRFSLIVDRLTKEMQSGEGTAQPDSQAVAQLLTMAAARSQNGQQLNDYLEQIRPLTGGKEGNVFIILGGAMPSWDIPGVVPGTGARPAQAAAMEKIIDLAEDPVVAMRRFRELVVAAIQKFNDGSLAAAIWMLDVANESITEKKLDVAAVERVRGEAADGINSVQLRKYVENKGRHAALKIALEFFPTLHLDRLFQQLRGEPRAERRRTILGLIEAHALAGREYALDQLDVELARADVDTYYLRNLIYLLHRILRESDETLERELQALTHASARGQNIYVIKEAVTAIGQIRTEAAAKLLTTRLAEFEAVLLRGDTSQYPAGEVQKLLDRITASLARIGTGAALLTIARHGMKANALFGDTRARLAALAQHDLSFDEETVNVLLKALRDEIPGKLFGRLLPKMQASTVRLIEALSGTRSDAAEELFADIAQRFPDSDVGRAAAQVLEKWAPPKPVARSGEPVATLTGELEFFGLPSVMQSLGEMRASGMLTLRTKQGVASAKLVFVDGKFINAQSNHIRGTDALYQTLERPIAGTFAFVPYPPEKMKSDNAPIEIMGLLLEGVRRHDELQTMLALVPDGMKLTKTSVKPTPHDDEKDPVLVREVWMAASNGTTVVECERQVATDSYRIRRLLSHWLEMGALVAAT
jgi:Domain of unknown function (DUF4388)